MTTTLLLLTLACGQPPQAPTPPKAVVTVAVQPPQAPKQPAETYRTFFERLRKGGVKGLLLVNRKRPRFVSATVEYTPTAAEIEAHGLEDGAWACEERNGEVYMTAAADADENPGAESKIYADAPGTHRHKCPKDGTVWSHAPGGSHACPACGYDGPETRRHYTGPTPPTAAVPVAPAKPKRISLGGRWYDQYADGTLVACSA